MRKTWNVDLNSSIAGLLDNLSDLSNAVYYEIEVVKGMKDLMELTVCAPDYLAAEVEDIVAPYIQG